MNSFFKDSSNISPAVPTYRIFWSICFLRVFPFFFFFFTFPFFPIRFSATAPSNLSILHSPATEIETNSFFFFGPHNTRKIGTHLRRNNVYLAHECVVGAAPPTKPLTIVLGLLSAKAHLLQVHDANLN